jgi:adenylate cyclase
MRGDALRLLGTRGRRLSGPALVRATRLALIAIVVLANIVGAAVVFALAALVLPGLDTPNEDRVLVINAIVGGAAYVVAVVVGFAIGLRYARPVRRWLCAERPPTEAEQRRALRSPLVILALQAVLWCACAGLLFAVNVVFSVELALRVAAVVALGGVTTSAITYLLSERALRPIAVRALAGGPPARTGVPGVPLRLLLAWSLGTAVPVVGIVFIGADDLIDRDATREELALTMVVLGGVALVVGLLAILVTALAINGPVRSVRRAVRAVERGQLDVEVAVDDGSELGRLQAGVNRMVAGLREREELRDLFGRHVGEDVARAALDRGVELGGEVVDVAVLFVDVVGSTRLASERPPQEVVELLNRFFDVVVEVVDQHDGWINKFEGDAALAIFGAPAPVEDRDAKVLAAARELARRLEHDVPGLAAGIGVSAGEVVAGNIGSTERFEYTVIGDPVNEAARLTEAAKDVPGRALVAAHLLDRAGPEAEHWSNGDALQLRGRREETRVATLTATAERP